MPVIGSASGVCSSAAPFLGLHQVAQKMAEMGKFASPNGISFNAIYARTRTSASLGHRHDVRLEVIADPVGLLS